jgi:hypothetical protein
MNHEEAVIKAFILPQRQQRYLEFLSNQKKRGKFTSDLAHFKALDSRYIVSIPPNQTNLASLTKLLTSRGAGSKCWVISENSELDAQEMELFTALRQTIGYGMGTIISCIPGKLAYFEDEEARYILQR